MLVNIYHFIVFLWLYDMGFPCLDEPPVISSMSDMEDIDLSDNEKPVESCEFVDDVEACCLL